MFAFSFDKTAEAVAHLLRNEPSKRLNYMRLIKLLYIADRQSIRETARPITGDRAFAMDRGPVLSQLYDLILDKHARSPDWDQHFRRVNYEIELIQDPGNDHLSRYEAATLSQVSEECAGLDEWDVGLLTHDFAEWKQNEPPQGSSKPIPPRDIFRAVGREADFAGAMSQGIEEAQLDALLRQAGR